MDSTTPYGSTLFLQHGFTIIDTSGGCFAWYKKVTGSNGTFYALITDSDGNLPDFDDICAGIYRDDDTGAVGDVEPIWDDKSEYAADCLDELIPSLAYYAGEAL